MGELNNSEKHPKVFISYSRTSEEYSDRVLILAKRLMHDGVDIVLDQKDLKPGMDVYKFMERCVNDPEISKVLILCDQRYAEKADKRDGGVGSETAVITSQVYNHSEQIKFIPVVMEKDPNGQAYLPSYLNGRYRIDLCNENEEKNEKAYEKLLDAIYDYTLEIKLGPIPPKYSHRKSGRETVRKGIIQTPEQFIEQYKDIPVSDIVLPDIGEIYPFGSYPQNRADKKERIEWRVLAREGRTCLLISKYALECKRYNEEFEPITWEECTLRKWLNRDFYNAAFSEEEKEKIAVTTVTADRNRKYKTNPGRDTKDKIFLLSIKEAEQYFSSDKDRECKPTPYTKKQGAYTDDNGNCWWWLRSPGLISGSAAYVDDGGSVSHTGSIVNYDLIAVRPALWVNL